MKKLLFGCLLLAPTIACALSLGEQRDIFSDTIALQEKSQWEKANQHMDSLKDYPLAYITESNYLKANMDKVSQRQMLDFMKQHKGKAARDDLQRAYLFHLAKKEDWKGFLTVYPRLPNNSILQCHYLQASIAEGNASKVWPDAKKKWLNSTSLPNACDDVYAFYQKNKTLTQTHIWQRFHLAYKKNKPGLMRFLMAKMDAKKGELAAQLYQLHEKPQRLLSSDLFPDRHSDSFAFLVPSIKKLAKTDLNEAMQLFTHFDAQLSFTDYESARIKIQFATLIVQRDIKEHFVWLDSELASLGHTSLIEQRIRYAIKRDDWHNIERWLKHLPQEKRNKSAWLYWEARVLEHNGQDKKAKKIYQKIARNRNYHGFMAAQKLGVDFSLNVEQIQKKPASLQNLDTDLALIEELLYHELNMHSKRQWRRLLKSHTVSLQKQLGVYAYDRGWAHLAVLASINSKSWDALSIRFPKSKPELFVNEADKYELEETYIYAIARRESSFDEHAKSPVGASGYMQLMPKTAEEVARDIGMKNYKRVAQLNQGEINVQLGTAYFNGLLTRYDGNRVLATAAYNAGPHRVDKWFKADANKKKSGIDMDSWIESIPFYETREYVQNVLVYNVIYQHILDKPLNFVKEQELLVRY